LGGDKHLRRPFPQTIIYELHAGLPKFSAATEESKRGTMVKKDPLPAGTGVTHEWAPALI
jgi:hypothetical protein